MDPKMMMNAMAGMKGPLAQGGAKAKAFKPCQGCPAPMKCKAAGKCAKAGA